MIDIIADTFLLPLMLNFLKPKAANIPRKGGRSSTSPIPGNHIFHRLIQNSQEGFTMVNEYFSVIYRNAAAEKINGWKADADVPEKIDDQLHPEDKERIDALLKEILAVPGLTKSAIFRTKHFQGHYIWLDCSFSNFFHDPEFKAFIFNFRDITVQKNYEQQLEQSERKFKALVENNADGIVVLDQNRKPLYISPGFTPIMGYTDEEAQVLNSFALIHAEDLPYAKQKMEECLHAPGVPVRNIVYRMRHKLGHYVTLNATLTNFLADPSIAGIVNNFRDVSEKKKNDAELVASERK